MMKILIQCGDHFENQCRVFLLASELKKQGFFPIILMYKTGGNIFKAHNISVVYLSKYLSKFNYIDEKKYNFTTQVYGELKIIDFISIEIKRRPILSWPSKISKTSSETLKYVKAIDELLEDINPQKVVVWNGFTGYVANVLRVLAKYKNISSSFIERGLLKDSIFIDHQGVNGNSSSTHLSSFPTIEDINLRNYISHLFLEKSNNLFNDDQLPLKLKGKRIVFFPLQVQLDTNILMYCNYTTMREVFFEIYRNLNDKNTFFVVRPHPEESPDTFSNFPLYNNLLISKDHSLDFWLEESDIVVTINSTVGLEALIKGKPVICLGKSIYSSLTCLSTYKNINKDKSFILNEMTNYLGYFLKNNLIVKDSIYNADIVNKIFGRSNIKNEINLKKIKVVDNIKVFIDFSLSGTLNLTYRKVSENITLDWMEENIISKISKNGKYEIVSNINESNVVITDKPYEKISFIDNITYFDVYGIQLN